MPVFRGRLTRKEPPYPTINSALDELDDPRRRGLDLPPRVVTVRHHPYGHRYSASETDDDNERGNSSFLIPDWIFDENINKNTVVFEIEPLPRDEQQIVHPIPQELKETMLRAFVHKTASIAHKIFSNKALRSR